MRKKAGWIWITGAILLFISDFFTLGNLFFIKAQWADILSLIISFVICPILLFIGIRTLILGEKE